MKTFTALIIALASLSASYAAEPQSSDPGTVSLPSIEPITIALADDANTSTGQCKAVCMLAPSSFE